MKRLLTLMFAILPLGAALVVLQSCGGQGGPTGSATSPVSPTQAFLKLLPVSQAIATYVGPENCATCHNDPNDPHYTEWQLTKHAANNVTCERCHGPGSVHSANATAGKDTIASEADALTSDILTLPNVASPLVCAQCHGPLVDDYNTSQHADVVERGNAGSPALNISASRCAACHNSVVRVATYDRPDITGTATDPFNPALITQAQVNVWGGFDTTGVKFNTNAPTIHTAACVTCHNPHKQTGNLDKDGDEHQVRHALTNPDDGTTVAPSLLATPGTLVGGYGYNTGGSSTVQSFQTLDQQCAQCHNGRGVTATDAKLVGGTSRPSMHDSPQFNMLMGFGAMELVTLSGSPSPLLPAIRNMGHATAPGQCSHCHMGDSSHSHSFKANAGVACAPCHAADDAAAKMITVTNDIIAKEYALQQRLRAWAAAQTWSSPNPAYAADLWDYTSLLPVGDAPPVQSAIPIEVKRARHNYYFVLRDKSIGVHNYPYTDYMISIANTNLTTAGAPAVITRALGSQPTIAQMKASIMADLQRAQRADLDSLND